MEIGAPELPVAHHLEACGLLLGHRVADGEVLDAPELRGAEDAGLGLLAGPDQGRWTQQAADVIGAKRRLRPDRQAGGVGGQGVGGDHGGLLRR